MGTTKQYFNNNYAREWYQYGLETNSDPIMKFTMHWIAFNWLYGDYYGTSDGVSDEGIERGKIRAFCKQNQQALSSYNPFDESELIKIFIDYPVYDARGYRKKYIKKIHNEMVYGSGVDKITNLLLTCYQVRCNLFHGKKMLKVARDVELVEKSSVILEGYLKAYFNYKD